MTRTRTFVRRTSPRCSTALSISHPIKGPLSSVALFNSLSVSLFLIDCPRQSYPVSQPASGRERARLPPPCPLPPLRHHLPRPQTRVRQRVNVSEGRRSSLGGRTENSLSCETEISEFYGDAREEGITCGEPTININTLSVMYRDAASLVGFKRVQTVSNPETDSNPFRAEPERPTSLALNYRGLGISGAFV